MTFDISRAFINQIKNRLLRDNKNWLCVICGGTGSGKSYSGIALAQLISNNFSIKNNLAFTPAHFMEKVTSGKLEKGDILVFDEAGVGINSKDWYSIQNKLINSVLQTFRHRNIGVIFTTPALNFMDRSARILTHTYMETRDIDRKENLCYLRPYKFDYNSRLDKIYWKRYRFHNDDGVIITLSDLAIGLPSEEILQEYEEAKEKYTGRLNREVLTELTTMEGKKKEISITPCSVCNNKSYYFMKKTRKWQCKRCGKIISKNPFK